MSSSSQNLEISMDCFFIASPLPVILCLLAWAMTSWRYSGYKVLRMLKKYYLGGPLSFAHLDGKNDAKVESFLNSGQMLRTDNSS